MDKDMNSSNTAIHMIQTSQPGIPKQTRHAPSLKHPRSWYHYTELDLSPTEVSQRKKETKEVA
jgi:hypothetical protein